MICRKGLQFSTTGSKKDFSLKWFPPPNNVVVFHSLTHISYQKFTRLTAHVIIMGGVIFFKVVVTGQLNVTWNVQFVLVFCASVCASTRQRSYAKVAMLS